MGLMNKLFRSGKTKKEEPEAADEAIDVLFLKGKITEEQALKEFGGALANFFNYLLNANYSEELKKTETTIRASASLNPEVQKKFMAALTVLCKEHNNPDSLTEEEKQQLDNAELIASGYSTILHSRRQDIQMDNRYLYLSAHIMCNAYTLLYQKQEKILIDRETREETRVTFDPKPSEPMDLRIMKKDNGNLRYQPGWRSCRMALSKEILKWEQEHPEKIKVPMLQEDIDYVMDLCQEIIEAAAAQLNYTCTGDELTMATADARLHDTIFDEFGLLKKYDGSGLAEKDIFAGLRGCLEMLDTLDLRTKDGLIMNCDGKMIR